MKNRFRFRVWNGKEMLYKGGLGYDGNQLIEDKGHIIMQSTGLKDRNGKLIYEGDLLKTRFGLILKVYWREQSAMFWLETLDGAIPFTFYAKQQLDGDLMEVIGNIYENKELLKEQK